MTTKNKVTKKKKETKAIKKTPEQMYEKEEILNAADAFRESPEVIAGALRSINKDSLTKSEVKDAIREFKTRKVY